MTASRSIPRQLFKSALLGFTSFAMSELVWSVLQPAGNRWVLEPTSGILFSSCIVVGTLIWLPFHLLRSEVAGVRFQQLAGIPAAFLLGLSVSIAFCMYTLGLENLWALALAIDVAGAVVLTLAGWFVALVLWLVVNRGGLRERRAA